MLPGAQEPGQAEIGNWLIAIPRVSQNIEAAMDFLLWATSAEQMKRSALQRKPADAQVALSRSATGGEVSRVSGAAAFTRNVAAAPAHAAVERDRKRLWHLSFKSQQRRPVSSRGDESGECRNRADSPARALAELAAAVPLDRSGSRGASRAFDLSAALFDHRSV